MPFQAKRVLVRDRCWDVRESKEDGNGRCLLTLLDRQSGEALQVLSPPETVEIVPSEQPVLTHQELSPWLPWLQAHQAIKLALADPGSEFMALTSGRIDPEPYQFAPVRKMLQLPRPCLLIADDVGLGKTVEAGICLMELIARGRGKRILLVVPPGLIPQWQDEMLEKFGLRFEAIENAASLDRAQTYIAEGIKPWLFYNRVITSIDYAKKREVMTNILEHPWDAIVVDEAHYLCESGTPRSPYTTARARMGQKLRDACSSLILLSATPHNGYGHSFRSLLEIVEPTDATFEGDREIVRRRVSRSMIRRLKSQIYKTDGGGNKGPAFQPREPVKQIRVTNLTVEEKAIFQKVSSYCAKTTRAAEGAEDSELVSFAMQIIKKRMLSSRAALVQTIEHRLDALKNPKQDEEKPKPAETHELKTDIPTSEATQERIAERILRTSVPREEKRRSAEKRQLDEIKKLLKKVETYPDPKIEALLTDIRRDVLSTPDEKAIVFTEYRDTLKEIREAFGKYPDLKSCFVELTGGLTSKQRRDRIARFEKPEIRILLATDAASEGLNLQFYCRRLYHFELPWNPNRMEQRNGRIDRHGQKRRPIIRYLFYPDSPEDHVLNRLVKRILEMQEDRVSTPDILGILSTARIEEVLTELDATDAGTGKETETSLFRIIEEKRKQFSDRATPLLSAAEAVTDKDLSADPMLGDDQEFESFMLRRLGEAATPGIITHTYFLTTPRELRGPGVMDRYPCITMRRSVAVSYPSRDVEYVNRLHPLFTAMVEEAYRRFLSNRTARRIAVRRHPAARKPYAVFSFSASQRDLPGDLLLVPVDHQGTILDQTLAHPVLDDSFPGEVSWEEVSRRFDGVFAAMQNKAVEAADGMIRKRIEALLDKKKEIAAILKEDAEQYCVDRMAEIDREEKEAKTAEDKEHQRLLFVDTRVSFKAKRAAVETFYKKRMAEIEDYLKPLDPVPPQALGVLFVFPEA